MRCPAVLAVLGLLIACDERPRNGPSLDPAPDPSAPPMVPPPGSTPSVPTSAAPPPTTTASASAKAPIDPFTRTTVRRTPVDFSAAPLMFTASFDGSQRFSMWIDTMRFARTLEREADGPVRLTYFINTCYFDPQIKGSKIGRARTRAEALTRRALVQLAINAGHDVGSHGVRHDNGLRWSAERWQAELDEFHAYTDRNLFRPVRDASGRAVFPRFAPTTDVAGAAGARCRADGDCTSGACVALTDEMRFCTQPCNAKAPCPKPLQCGAPTFRDDTDQCVPLPVHPVVHGGVTLFDEAGRPNLKALEPYRIVGYRAPFLAGNDGLTEALIAHRYIYDASQLSPPGAPMLLGLKDGDGSLLGFPLMQHRHTRTIPMDYNYLQVGASGRRMETDYRRSLVAAYQRRARTPWNVGHHFSLWRDGAYWAALQRSMRFAAAGCPDDDDEPRCPEVAFVSFRELSRIVVRALRRKRDDDVPAIARIADRHRKDAP